MSSVKRCNTLNCVSVFMFYSVKANHQVGPYRRCFCVLTGHACAMYAVYLFADIDLGS